MRERAIAALRQIEASSATGIWGAHRGCAAIAGAFLIANNLVQREAAPAIEAQMNRLLQMEERAAAAPASRGEMSFADFASALLSELAIHADDPKELGHDVIYSAYVLTALGAFHISPWESLLRSTVRLIREIKAAGPGWITLNGRNCVRPLPEIGDSFDKDCWQVFSKFNRSPSMETGDMQLGHLLTHGHAIASLTQYARPELIEDLKRAYGRRVAGLEAANREQTDQAPMANRAIDPRTPHYWSQADRHGDMHDGHVIKYAYSFLDIRRSPTLTDMRVFGRIVWPGQDI